MSTKSNDKGRAYEYACLQTLKGEIAKYRDVVILNNSSLQAAKRAWSSIDVGTRNILTISAKAAVATLFDMEPLILEDDNDKVELFIQADRKGEAGDVRDIIIGRKMIRWEIGLSIKHNHFAVKHSRIAKTLDFGEKWFNHPCSRQYWSDIKPVFDYIQTQIDKNGKWRDLPAKKDDVYVPLLRAFIAEIKRTNAVDAKLPRKMVEYLLGEFDFYKLISIDNKKVTQIQTYNLHSTLNKPSKKKKPSIFVPEVSLPSRIVCLDFKPGSKNTIELFMDGGWQFTFRIHSASTYVEPSLKFDIQIIGMPTSIISLNCIWNQ